MKKIILSGLIFSLFFQFSCNTDNDNGGKEENKEVIIQQENLDERVNTENAGVVSSIGITSLKSATIEDDEPAGDLPLVLVAEVTAPEYEGKTLRATHVAISGHYAYVSYNFEGDVYLGAIDVIDITDPDHPQVAQSAIFPTTDLSSVDFIGNALYMAGAKGDVNEDGSDPAVLLRMNLDGGFMTENIQTINMLGYVATDVLADGNYFYGVSGNNGILGAYSYVDNSLQMSTPLSDLRALGINGGNIVVLSGSQGIHIFNAASLSEESSISTSSDVDGAKRTIDFYDGNVLAAEGFSGVGVYNLASGSKVISIPVADASGLDVAPSEVVCNAVSVNDEHIFIANGAAGVSVFSVIEGAVDNLTNLGSLDLPGSANYVKSSGEYVFVADGFGGLQILKMVTVDPETEAGCSSYPVYTGNQNLNVNSGEILAYSGSASLLALNVNSQLTWCGSLGVSQHVNVNSQGTFVMTGSLATGQKSNGNANSGASLIVNSKMIMDGSLAVYGDLIINSGGSLEFKGTNSSIAVYGSVTINSGGEIIGTYTDETDNVKK